MSKNPKWSREETIVAFNLYCKLPFGKLSHTNRDIINLAKIIGRTPSSVSMKLCNIARLDPELKKQGTSGLTHGAGMEKQIWDEFYGNWDDLAYESEMLLSRFMHVSSKEIEKDLEDIPLPIGADKAQLTKVRINQKFFRDTVLSAYDNCCCITGLAHPALLIASHIKPWKDSNIATERTNPKNGLCLNPLHDKAYDQGLITVDPNFRVVLSSSIKEMFPKRIVAEYFCCYEGKTITLPKRFMPLKSLLEYHSEHIFVG